MSLFDLTGKVALVTGATKGIGLGIAEQLAAHGAKVIVSSRDQNKCDEVARQINERFGNGEKVAVGIASDLGDRVQMEALPGKAADAFGGLDILVSNAAVLAFIGASRDTPPETFDALLTGNIHHNFRLCQAARAELAKRGGGSIILIGSVSGHKPQPSVLAYGVSKAGIAYMAKMLAEEMAPEKIRVNCVAPGLIRSFTSEMVWKDADRLSAAENTIPLGRIGEPEDVASAVIFLACDAGSYVTGTTVHVDGGRGNIQAPGASAAHLQGMTRQA